MYKGYYNGAHQWNCLGTGGNYALNNECRIIDYGSGTRIVWAERADGSTTEIFRSNDPLTDTIVKGVLANLTDNNITGIRMRMYRLEKVPKSVYAGIHGFYSYIGSPYRYDAYFNSMADCEAVIYPMYNARQGSYGCGPYYNTVWEDELVSYETYCNVNK